MPPARNKCPLPNSELVLNTIVAGLLSEGRMPGGSLVDAGAHMGRWACYYAAAAPNRVVHAIEPMSNNVEHMGSYYRPSLPNLRPMQGALGDVQRVVDGGFRTEGIRRQVAGVQYMRLPDGQHPSRRPDGPRRRELFTIYRLDDLFAGEQLGFLHLDVEGSELAALKGGNATIRRDQPVFTVELHVHQARQAEIKPAFAEGPKMQVTSPPRHLCTHIAEGFTTACGAPMRQERKFTRDLLSYIDSLGYDSFVIEEPCGVRADCRNLLNLPRRGATQRASPFYGSPTLDLATAARRLFAVDGGSIFEHAYPCCARGGACCNKNTVGGAHQLLLVMLPSSALLSDSHLVACLVRHRLLQPARGERMARTGSRQFQLGGQRHQLRPSARAGARPAAVRPAHLHEADRLLVARASPWRVREAGSDLRCSIICTRGAAL